MLFSWLRKPETLDLRLNQFKDRLKGAKHRLVKVLENECERLDDLVNNEHQEKYPEEGIAKVLLASGQYYQFLKLNAKKAAKPDRVLMQYLSPIASDKQTFHVLCTSIYKDIETRDKSSPMLQVRYNDLLNAYMYLLEYLA